MSPFSPIGATRERIYRYLRERLEQGQPPTVREVQAAFGFRAVETARKHLDRLVAEGRLSKHAGRSRGYHLPDQDARPRSVAGSAAGSVAGFAVPLLGRIPAGGLREAIELQEGQLMLEADRYPGAEPEAFFALRVEGESMRDAGILPGDVVVVRVQPDANSGEIVVAMVDDEATVKTLRRRGRAPIELWPENPEYEPIVPPPGALVILGKVVELRRDLRRRPAQA